MRTLLFEFPFVKNGREKYFTSQNRKEFVFPMKSDVSF